MVRSIADGFPGTTVERPYNQEGRNTAADSPVTADGSHLTHDTASQPNSPNSLRLGARRLLLLGALAAVALATPPGRHMASSEIDMVTAPVRGLVAKIGSVLHHADEASQEAAAHHPAASTNPNQLAHQAQATINANHLSQVGAVHHTP